MKAALLVLLLVGMAVAVPNIHRNNQQPTRLHHPREDKKAPVCTCCDGFECTIQSCSESGSNIDAVMQFTLGTDFACNGKQLREQITGVIKVTNWLDVTGNNNLGRRRVAECTSTGIVLKAGSTVTVQVAPTTSYGSGTGVYTLFETAEDENSHQLACGKGSF
eukprot:TRINITY_DN184_c0_g2_i4.p1 TRINITY_DN184_c0_g2~~TRINITY_DN184_c0_g2_i4.p1  ORF type:complete len:163 (-),score=43.96 TRINITY_DN184_c0_g2_i4:78-566(-)